jgi:hypothetical protein
VVELLSIVADPLNVFISGQSFKKRCVYWANSSILAQMNTDISYRVLEVALVKLLAGPVSGWVGFRDFRGPVCTHKYRNSDRNISDPWIFIQWSRTSPGFFPKTQATGI